MLMAQSFLCPDQGLLRPRKSMCLSPHSPRVLTIKQVFSVLFTEPAGTTATSYNSSLTLVKYGEYAHTQVRRFIVVRQKRAFCFAMYVKLSRRLTSSQANSTKTYIHIPRSRYP